MNASSPVLMNGNGPADRLLAVSGVAPWPPRGGFPLRAARLLEHLSEDWRISLIVAGPVDTNAVPLRESRGHEIVAASCLHGEWGSVPPLGGRCGLLLRTFDRALAAAKPRAVLLLNGTEFLAFGRSGSLPAAADRVDCGTLERLRYLRRGRYRRGLKTSYELLRQAHYERRIVRELRMTIVAGEDDRRALEYFSGSGNIRVVPNGVNTSEFPAFDAESPVPTVAFTGTLSYHANGDAIVEFAHRLWPAVRRRVPGARLLIAGRSPSRRVLALQETPGVEVRPDVDDMSAVLEEAWVAIAPMKSGAGVKNKVLEAWAVGRPAVITPIGANGLCLDAQMRRLVTGDHDEFFRTVSSLLEDREARHRYGRAAHRLARTRHSWKDSAEEVSNLLRSLSDNRA